MNGSWPRDTRLFPKCSSAALNRNNGAIPIFISCDTISSLSCIQTIKRPLALVHKDGRDDVGFILSSPFSINEILCITIRMKLINVDNHVLLMTFDIRVSC